MIKKHRQTGEPQRWHRIASCFFAAQSMLGLFWWIGIEASPDFASMFFSVDTVHHDLQTFVFADVFWFVVMSGMAALLIWRKSRMAPLVVWCLVGAIGYAFFCCIGLAIDGGKWLSVGLMAGSWVGTLFFAAKFRAAEMPTTSNGS